MSSSYKDASVIAKGIVSGLTAVTTWFRPPQTIQRLYRKPCLSIEEVTLGIREDFRRGYLFNGEIDEEIYAEKCTFTDPTLSFEGLDTFVNNIAAIRPLMDRLLDDSVVILYSLTPNISIPSSVQATWRMSGGIRLPWRPRIELVGQTTFRIDPSEGGRVVDYHEIWFADPLQILLQVLKPVEGSPDLSMLAETSTWGKNATSARPTVSLILDELKADLFSSVESGNCSAASLQLIIRRLEFIYSVGALPESLSINSGGESMWEIVAALNYSPSEVSMELFNYRSRSNNISDRVEILASEESEIESWRVLYQDKDVRIIDVLDSTFIYRRVLE